VADPYAARPDLAPPERLGSPDSGAADVVRGAGGFVLTSLGAAAGPIEGEFAAVLLEEDGLLPPLARIGPELAAALLSDPSAAGAQDDAVVAAARSLLDSGKPLFLFKSGLVAGPAGRPGALELPVERVRAALDAALAGSVGWELDPDFGYEVAAAIPGFDGAEADAFCPRLLYANHDRVYDHAQLVEATKRRRYERLSEAGVVDEGILAAVGWPMVATGQEWKD
jgi:hypothetical protein